MYKLLIFANIFFLPLAGKSQSVPVLHINPKQTYGGLISEHFSSLEYIPLETTPESLFGDIARLIITDSSFIVSDADTKSILFFDVRGKYLRKIRSGRAVFPYVDYDANKKIVSACFINKYDIENGNSTKKKVMEFLRFSATGIPVDTINVEVRNENLFEEINLEPGYTFRTNSCSFKDAARDSTIYLLDIFRGTTLYKHLIPYNQQQKMGFCYFSGKISSLQKDYTTINGVTYAATPVEHHIYKITKDTAIKMFEVVFPKDAAVPKDMLKIRDTRLLDSIRLIARPPGIIYRITNIFFSGNKLFFKGTCPFYLSNISTSTLQAYNFIYDTVSRKVVALERLTPDAKSFFLPVFDPRDGLMEKGILYNNDNFYSYVSSLDMFIARQKTKDKNPQYPPALQDYFNTQSRKSNPVIVKMKLKD